MSLMFFARKSRRSVTWNPLFQDLNSPDQRHACVENQSHHAARTWIDREPVHGTAGPVTRDQDPTRGR